MPLFLFTILAIFALLQETAPSNALLAPLLLYTPQASVLDHQLLASGMEVTNFGKLSVLISPN